MAQPGPLSGITIVDLSRILAGPYCTLLLAEMGARVIKVETPKTGDDARHYGPFTNGKSTYFASVNRGKESIALDLKAAGDREIFERLLDKADAIVENFRPGTMEKLGYGWETLHQRYPQLIYAAASGFGHTGPYSHHPSYDMVVQGLGGIMSITGHPGEPLAAHRHVDRRSRRRALHDDRAQRRAAPPRAHRRGDQGRCRAVRLPARAPRKRDHALHDDGRNPRPARRAPSVDHAVRGVQDQGRRHHHRRRQRRAVGQADRGARPPRARAESRTTRPTRCATSISRSSKAEIDAILTTADDGPLDRGAGSRRHPVRPDQQRRAGARASAGRGAQHAGRGRRRDDRPAEARRQPDEIVGLRRSRRPAPPPPTSTPTAPRSCANWGCERAASPGRARIVRRRAIGSSAAAEFGACSAGAFSASW